MNIELPENIRKILLNKEFKVNTVGKTSFQVYMYNNMVLKIQNQSNETLVFTHGDFCFENIFAKNGHINGFIDLGKAGIADRWQDLAICIRELDDLNPNYSSLLLKKLGIEKDDFKLKYYMLLDELF